MKEVYNIARSYASVEEEVEWLRSILQGYTTFFLIFDFVFFAVAVTAIILAINFLKSREQFKKSHSYLRYAIQGQEEERSRIARELHDTVAQDLRWCKNVLEKQNTDELKKISEVVSKTLKMVRSLSLNLAPPDIIKNDFHANVLNLCQNFSELNKVEFRLTVMPELDTKFLSADENLNLYRIVQEALTNIQKHAEASEVTVLIRNELDYEAEGLYVFITDGGKGFDVSKVEGRGSDCTHFGITGMKERAELIGAQLEISSVAGEGTCIQIVKLKESL
ncbi:sensor histidine kinase [Treponema sp.]|uniref:sensor histidine kinase n=1 Tax=Treponema sp. TaxID=166 RepID=UPI0025D22473|nr:sensor histidine kinase [Treponema sp.]MCR5219330.1 sensor histidine kinase [Treponema sp.]